MNEACLPQKILQYLPENDDFENISGLDLSDEGAIFKKNKNRLSPKFAKKAYNQEEETETLVEGEKWLEIEACEKRFRIKVLIEELDDFGDPEDFQRILKGRVENLAVNMRKRGEELRRDKENNRSIQGEILEDDGVNAAFVRTQAKLILRNTRKYRNNETNEQGSFQKYQAWANKNGLKDLIKDDVEFRSHKDLEGRLDYILRCGFELNTIINLNGSVNVQKKYHIVGFTVDCKLILNGIKKPKDPSKYIFYASGTGDIKPIPVEDLRDKVYANQEPKKRVKKAPIEREPSQEYVNYKTWLESNGFKSGSREAIFLREDVKGRSMASRLKALEAKGFKKGDKIKFNGKIGDIRSITSSCLLKVSCSNENLDPNDCEKVN